MCDLILYQFSRDRLEVGDAKDYVSRFGSDCLPTGKELESLMIDGYTPSENLRHPRNQAEFCGQLWKVRPIGYIRVLRSAGEYSAAEMKNFSARSSMKLLLFLLFPVLVLADASSSLAGKNATLRDEKGRS